MSMRIKALSAFQLPDGSMSVPGTIYSNIAEAFGAARVGEKRAEDVDGALQPASALRVEQHVSDGALYNERGEIVGGGGGASAFSALTDKETVDIPATNAPTAAALAGKASLVNGGVPPSQLPRSTAAVSLSATTSATPTDATFAALPAQACTELEVFNDSQVPVEYRRNGAGSVVTILANQRRRILGITDASQIAFRRSDYAVAGRTQPTTISARARTNTDTYTLAATLSMVLSGGSYTAFGSQACTSMELFNNCNHDILFTIDNGTPYKLRHGESTVILNIANANQVRVKTYDSIARQSRNLEAECWTVGPGKETLSQYRADAITAEADILNGEPNYPNLQPIGAILTLGNLRSVPRLRKKPVELAKWDLAANVVTNRAADFADVTPSAVGKDEITFGTTIVEYTQSQTAEVLIAPAAAQATPVDVSNGSIHFTHVWPDNAGNNFGVNGPSSFIIELHSAGSPSAPTANFHTSGVLNSLNPGFMGASTLGYNLQRCFSLPINAFTAAGTGATLTAITWARIRITGPSAANGCKLRPVRLDFVPNALTKGTVIFTFDDLHAGAWTNALPIMSKYSYPGVLCMDTAVKMGQSGFLTPEQIIQMHQVYGWEVGYQVYQNETGFNLNSESWMRQVGKWVLEMNRLGIHETYNGSYGSATVTNVDEERLLAARRALSTMRRFTSGTNTSPPFKNPETLPYGDPYNLRCMNMSSGFTAGTIYDRWKDHVDQAVAAKGVAIFACHSEFNGAGEALTALGSLCAYIRTLELAGTCQVTTFAGLHKQAYAF